MPCLNEAETVATCVRKARRSLTELGITGEVIVADNGSTDGSQELAREAGATVVDIERKGYGSALLGGIASAKGRYVIMGDADDSYDFATLGPFVEKLRDGYDVVMGNRFLGGIKPGAMPALHRYLGNPVLSSIGRLFFKSPVGDFHCGLRGFSREAVEKLDLRTTGMEFASEMVVKATLNHLRIAEVPTTLSVAGRTRPPHLRSWRDGWKHLRFLLLYSPRWLFFYPGLALMVAGTLGGAILLTGPKHLGGTTFDIQTLLYAAAAVVIGYQAVLFALFSKVFAVSEGLMPGSSRLGRFRRIRLESGLLVGAVLFFAGLAGSILALVRWGSRGFGPLHVSPSLRIAIPSVTAMVLGSQTLFGSFFFSVLKLKRK